MACRFISPSRRVTTGCVRFSSAPCFHNRCYSRIADTMLTGSGNLLASKELGRTFRRNEIARIRSALARVCIARATLIERFFNKDQATSACRDPIRQIRSQLSGVRQTRINPMLKFLKASMSILSWITTPPTRHPRSKRGSPAGLTIMSILRRPPRHGSIRSSAGSLNSPESRSSEVSTPPSGSSRPHPYLHRPAQQKPEALQMDQVCRPDLGFRQTLLSQSPAHFMWRTLDSRD
jgi:hypothetical protein